MKEKAPRIEGRKTDKYSFEYGNEKLKIEIAKLDPKKDAEAISKLEKDFVYYEYEIQEPTFDELTVALSQVKTTGRTDVIGAGKVIWELCCVSHDEEIEKKPKILISVCINLFDVYVSPIDLEIKKK